MKSLLCVLLTMIISLGSMVTVKADTEIKPYENKENAVLLKREYIDLDEDTVIEIESYEEKIPSLARAGWKTTSATKTYRVKDKNTNTVFVKYILKALLDIMEKRQSAQMQLLTARFLYLMFIR